MARITKAQRQALSDAARALRAIPSAARSAASKRNGALGGRPRPGYLSERDMIRAVKVVAADLCLDSIQARTLRDCARTVRHEAIRDRIDLEHAAQSLAFHPATLFRNPITSQACRPSLCQCKQILAGVLL